MAKFKIGDKLVCFADAGRSNGSFKIGKTYIISEVDGETYRFQGIYSQWTPDYFSSFLRPEGFQNGDILVDKHGRDYYFIGYGHEQEVVVQDKYDDTWMARTWDSDFRGEPKLKSEVITELTLDEIAKKFDIPVSQLKIKK